MEIERTNEQADSAEITALIAEFHFLIDTGRAGECAALFSPDAIMTFGPGSPQPGDLVGLDAISAFLNARQAMTNVTTRHVLTNIRLASGGLDTIAATATITLYRADSEERSPDVAFIADLDETYRRSTDGRWLIHRRKVTPVFRRS